MWAAFYCRSWVNLSFSCRTKLLASLLLHQEGKDRQRIRETDTVKDRKSNRKKQMDTSHTECPGNVMCDCLIQVPNLCLTLPDDKRQMEGERYSYKTDIRDSYSALSVWLYQEHWSLIFFTPSCKLVIWHILYNMLLGHLMVSMANYMNDVLTHPIINYWNTKMYTWRILQYCSR